MSKTIKVSDFIVEFLMEQDVTDVFGYPGGMVTHLMDSLSMKKDKIHTHLTYHEQAAAFAACGYAQASYGKKINPLGVAFATSGPGATNLVTGIANAYFDSIPTLFITGQVNTYENADGLKVRQKGFQETDIVNLVKGITKYSIRIDKPGDVSKELSKAVGIALEGRPGPVLLDIPMNVSRSYIKVQQIRKLVVKKDKHSIPNAILLKMIKESKRPVIIAGSGINTAGERDEFRKLIAEINVPVVTSMIAIDLLGKHNKHNFGFLGAYGRRTANIIVNSSDLIICIGSRLDNRQTGSNLELFAPKAKLIRFDIDKNELNNKIKNDEICVHCDIHSALITLSSYKWNSYYKWMKDCHTVQDKLSNYDDTKENIILEKISEIVKGNQLITVDVGQNMVWTAQSFDNKPGQKVLFSGGLGSMGYAVPAAIGAYYVNKKPIVVICGDGGFQMNLQELNYIKREQIPLKIIVINNHSLGMIRYFQKLYFNSDFFLTDENNGYMSINIKAVAKAYSINYVLLRKDNYLAEVLNNKKPYIIEMQDKSFSINKPKSIVNKSLKEQFPELDNNLYEEIMSILK